MILLPLVLALTAQDGPLDLAALPQLPYRAPPVVTQPMVEYVAEEARQRRCPVRRNPDGAGWNMEVHMAVLVNAAGDVRVVVPRAMNCPTVEQFAAGLVSSFARNNLLPRGAATDQWYRTRLTFSSPR